MRKRLIVGLLWGAMTLAVPVTAWAETDPFGNEIDWDMSEGSGGEDQAGSERVEESQEIPDYDIGEQLEVIGQIQAAETTAPEEKGYVTSTLKIPGKDWSEGNIKITLYDGTRKEEIWLYRQTAWSSRDQLPIGHYTIAKAETADGNYAFSVSPSTFDLAADTPVTLTLSLGTSAPEVIIPEDKATPSETDEDKAADDGAVEKKQNRMFWMIPISMLIGGVIGGGLFFKKRNEERNRWFE